MMPPEFHQLHGQYAECLNQHQQHQSGSFSTQELGILHNKIWAPSKQSMVFTIMGLCQ